MSLTIPVGALSGRSHGDPCAFFGELDGRSPADLRPRTRDDRALTFESSDHAFTSGSASGVLGSSLARCSQPPCSSTPKALGVRQVLGHGGAGRFGITRADRLQDPPVAP